LSALLGVFTVALALALTPGPNQMYLISRTLTQGRRAGAISLLGVAAGFTVYLTATNLGLSVLFAAVPELFLALRVAGACYLAWLAFRALRPGGSGVFETRELGRDRPRRLFVMGAVTNLLNPKIAVMYLSLIPQFIRPDRGHVVVQGFVLGGVQIAVALTVNLLIVLGADAIARCLAARPVWLRTQRYVMGTVLGALAVRLATDHTRAVPAA